jgi:DNA-binding phage protein
MSPHTPDPNGGSTVAEKPVTVADLRANLRQTHEEEARRLVDQLRAEFDRQAKDGMTVYRLAQQTGHTQINLAEVLKGKEMPGLARFVGIAAALGLRIEVSKDRRKRK